MVPLPGDISIDELAAIYLEVATLSNKLNKKPLSARYANIRNNLLEVITSVDSFQFPVRMQGSIPKLIAHTCATHGYFLH